MSQSSSTNVVRLACTNCRSHKLPCSAVPHPETLPCERCVKLDIECVITAPAQEEREASCLKRQSRALLHSPQQVNPSADTLPQDGSQSQPIAPIKTFGAACAGCRRQRQKCSMTIPCTRCARVGRECLPYKKRHLSDAGDDRTSSVSQRARIQESNFSGQDRDDLPFSTVNRSAASIQHEDSPGFERGVFHSSPRTEPLRHDEGARVSSRSSMPGVPYSTTSAMIGVQSISARSQSAFEFPDSGSLLRRTMPAVFCNGNETVVPTQSPAPTGEPSGSVTAVIPQTGAPRIPLMNAQAPEFDMAVSSKMVTLSDVNPGPTTATIEQVWKLEDVEIGARNAADLFAHFYDLYAPQLPLPILEVKHTPSQCFERNQLLFWAILVVASRTWNRDTLLLGKLSKPVRDLALSSLAERGLDSVQAILLLLNWPVRETLATDSRVPLAAGMIMMARRAGIHRPAHGQDFVRAKGPPAHSVVVSRSVLWVCCLIIYRNTCIGKGHDVGMFIDSRDNNLDGYKRFLSAQLTFRLDVSDCLANCLSTMQNFGIEEMTEEKEHAFKHLLGTFEAQMAALRARAVEFSGDERLFCKMHELVALSLYFHLDIKVENWHIFYRLAECACEVVRGIDKIIQRDPKNALKLPIESIWALLLSGTALLRLMRSTIASTFDNDRLESCIFAARDGLEAMSRRDNKAAAKLTLLLSQLANSQKAFRASDGSIDTLLRVRTRMAASSVFDAARWWRDEFGPADAGEKIPTLEGGGGAVNSETGVEAGGDGELVGGMEDINWMFLDFDSVDWGSAGLG